MSFGERQPLLWEDRRALLNATDGFIHRHLSTTDGHSALKRSRHNVQVFLTSKTGHYCVLLLVGFDVSCIFADFLIKLFQCEKKRGGEGFEEAQSILGTVSLVFSCLFMLELLASVWAFGFIYFKSMFHCFDATVIVAGFIIDVVLKGIIEEVGSLVVVLRLWRVFKIIEELSAGAAEQLDTLDERIEQLEQEKETLKREVESLRRRNTAGEALQES
ncbi:MAG: hypothetical protein M1834_002048 [Cirrosporium novae-zelandiae]|nr:MAG: hypothetical protein M1834_002048 [Cirrosporium novae-zelandiae]